MDAHVQTGPTLPAELILETFRYLSLPDRVAARAVCRAWHALADACPVIIPGKINHEADKLHCYLTQLRTAPLLYAGIVEIYNSDYSDYSWLNEDELEEAKKPKERDVAQVIGAHMDRTVVLSLLIICQDDIPEAWRPVLEAPAPLLQKLWLLFEHDNDVGDISLFSHCAPLLTHCCLFAAGDIVEAMCPFKTIEVLELEGPNWHNNLVLALTSFPVLRELSLKPRYTDDIDDEYEDISPRFDPMRPPASLAHLTIASKCHEITDIARMFAWIVHDALRVVCVRHFSEPNTWAQAHAASAPTVQRMLDVLALPAVASLVISCAPDECALRLLGPDGRERVHAGVSRKTLAVLLKTSPPAAAVTDLLVVCLHVLYTPDLVPLLNHFKALRSFTLVLRRLEPEREQFSASLSIPPIYCPALESVTLAITQDDYDRTGSARLTSKEVREFLRDKLREDLRRKLKSLCFRGVSVEDVSALQPLADEIDVRAYEPLRGFVFPEDEHRRFDQDGLLAG